MSKFRVLSLFAGIGGFDLGLERTGGFETVAFCEIDKEAQAVLRKYWPKVPIYDDVRELTGERLAADGIAVDVIVGGFPCQDISAAGLGAGITEGTRSGLWADYARLISELRPQFVIVENVSALLIRGLDRVLGDLAEVGYDAWWDCIPASAVGAPHRRDRIWIIAHPASNRRTQRGAGNAGLNDNQAGQQFIRAQSSRDSSGDGAGAVADAGRGRCSQSQGGEVEQSRGAETIRPSSDLADAGSVNEQGKLAQVTDPQERAQSGERQARPCGDGFGWWAVEPAVGRVAHGVPGRVDRLKQLGNAVVPQVVELLGNAILASIREPADA